MKTNKPSFLDKVKNIAKDTAAYLVDGARNVPKEEFIRRAGICDSCVHFIHNQSTCGICGCWMDVKAKWRKSKCPKDKW
jgi:hypothetical protein